MLESFKLAFQSMLGNKMRTFLTMLGIVIGVASVITLLSIVNGSTRQIMGQFSDIGANQISVNLVQMDTRRVTEEDMYKFYDANRALFSEITPNMMIEGGIKYGKEKLKSTNISGVSEQYALIKSYKMAYGRFISYTDIAYRQKVAVVGYYVASKLFKEPKQAVGEKINIKGDMYEIVGVIAKRDENAMSKGGSDDVACVPYSTAIKAMKTGIPSMYTLTTSDTKNTQQALTALQDMLMEVYQNKDFFTVNAMAELLKQLNSMVATMSVMLGGIAGISLLVAGVGVMNIMLVSVT
ncbi:MAG: ABC transporter permease, partial [Lachnospiraceae bacterium]